MSVVPSPEAKLCQCSWPVCMRSMVNYCLYCRCLIPIDDVDLSPMQRETRQRLESVGVRWPKDGD